MVRKKITSCFAALVLGCFSMASHAESSYPSRSVAVVVPYSPGGSSDIAARLVASKLSEMNGQTFIVENKPGAGGNIGAAFVKREKPDGYTILLATTGHAINQTLFKKLNYSLINDFTPVTTLVSGALTLLVKGDSPMNNTGDLLSYIKANPGKTSFGSAGIGSSPHLAAEIMRDNTPFDSIHIPFSGSSNDITALIGGQVTFSFETLPASLAFIKSGKVKALAISTAKRDPDLPDVPTMQEQGFTGFDVAFWNGFFVPKDTPAAVSEKLNAQIKQILAMPDVVRKFKSMGVSPDWRSLADSKDYMKGEVKKYAQVITKAKISIE
ncbi:tripartite tricarboxylate transporter substrate binding protein [Paralcaligenes sp. KSB-10]|uniref:Bug family tripartite tricarboxylate transporter substrate binding protein n=1 Tax=Paralcaligenes sp. KSB-10 TaxID=2901142 RepID=UPI001E6562CC|nr:tripartite tricarboxylate transporter substrate binding protein [Paralcaligenes sp. KSB-10]UHL65441.1 tripartite tricarboxylate transporter substrate binding protein [Paralcaligenes sp. KSB-10]